MGLAALVGWMRMDYLSSYSRSASLSKNWRYCSAPTSSLSARAASARQLWSFFQACLAACVSTHSGASGVSALMVRGLPILVSISHALKASDVSSMSHVAPDCQAASPNAPRCAAFRSVERSIPCSTLSSLIVFMLLLCNGFFELVSNTHQSHTRLHSFLWQIKDTVFCHRSFCQGFNGLSNQLKSFFHCCNSFHFLVLTFFISSVPLGTLLVYSAIAEKSRGFAMNIHISQKLVIHAEVTLKGEVGLC